MKSILIALFFFSSVTLFGQQFTEIPYLRSPVVKPDFKLKPNKNFSFRTIAFEWFNIQNDLFNLSVLNPNSSSLIPFHIFPDSTIYFGLTNTGEPVSAWLHGVADIINPSMTPGNWIDSWGEVVIDSIDIFKGYQRTTASSIIDTLFIDFIKSSVASSYLDIINKNNSYDSGEFLNQPINYDQANNKLFSSGVFRTDTVLLTEDDSSTFITSTELYVNDTVKGGDRYGVYVKFKPGYTWNKNNDTLGNYNTFFMISREQETGESPIQYWADNAGFSSYVLPKSVRYNQAGSSNGFLIPTAAYSGLWEYEHHYIWYKLTSNELGIKNVSLNVSSVGNYPNPSSSNSTVSFTLNQRDEVRLIITDLSGKLIEAFNLGSLSSGQHLEQIDLSRYNNGNYILSVNGSSKIITVVH